VASELSAGIATGLLTPVYAQMNPETIGSDYRDLNVALQYGIRLAVVSKNADLSTVLHLVQDYPSHDFIIDNEEAEALFENVEEPSDQLYDLLETLGEMPYIEQEPAFVSLLTQPRDQQQKGGADDDDGQATEVDKDGNDDRTGDSKSPSQDPSRGASDPSEKDGSPLHSSRRKK
jgi:hypothetical protein